MYTVNQVAKMLGVDSPSVYGVIINHSQTLSPTIRKKDGVQYISKKGLNIISAIYKRKPDFSKSETENVFPTKTGKEIKKLLKTIGILEKEIERLDEIIEEKDNMIVELLSDISETDHV